MATLYGKASGGNFSGANWSSTGSGGVDSVTPTSADDCILEAGSGNFTLNAGSLCRSLDCTTGSGNYTGTLTGVASTAISIGDATAGAGNVAIKFSSTTSYVVAGNAAFSFISTSATQQTVDFAGKTNLGNLTFSGIGSNYLLTGNLSTAGGLTHTAGTLNTNGQTVGLSGIAGFTCSGTNARTLTLGSSAINMVSSAVGWTFSGSNLTITANTAVVTISGASAPIILGGFNFNGMSMVLTGSGVSAINIGGASATLGNLTKNTTAIKTDSMTVNAPLICTGTLTLAGNSTVNRLLVQSSVIGTSRTITAAVVSISNADFMDIVGSGSAAPWTGTSLGDCLGNSGIIFDTPAPQSRSGSGGNWSTAGNWTSRVPLPQDDVFVGSGASGTIVVDMPRIGRNVDFIGFTGAITASGTGASSYGNLTLASGMTFTTTSVPYTLLGRSSHTLTSAGKSFGNSLIINAVAGTYILQDDLTIVIQLSVNGGTFTTNDFNISASTVVLIGAATVGNFGTSTVSITNTTATTVLNATSGAVFNGSTATFIISTPSNNSRAIQVAASGSTRMVGTLIYTVANSPGALTFGTSAPSIGTLSVGAGRILTMTSSTTTSFSGNFNVNGANNGYQYVPGVSGNYISSPDTPALSVTGDIDIRLRLAMDNWAPPLINMLISKLHTSGQYGYDWYVNISTGRFSFRISTNGTTLVGYNSSASPAISNGQPLWLRATRSASTGDVKFYTAADSPSMPASWTQLGTTITGTSGAIFDGTNQLELGTSINGNGNWFVGKYYQAQIRNNILDDGSGIVFDADLTTKPFGANSFVESSSNAATVTINGALVQAGDGRVSLVSSTPGTPAILSKASGDTACNYLTIQDSTATGGAAWYAGANSINISGNSGWIFGAIGAAATRASGFMPFFN